jgi:cell division protein FtsB
LSNFAEPPVNKIEFSHYYRAKREKNQHKATYLLVSLVTLFYICMTKYSDKSAFMNNETLPQLEQLIDQLIAQNNKLSNEVSSLKEQNSKLIDENETLQLEVLESEEKQKETSNTLANLLGKLQSATQAS